MAVKGEHVTLNDEWGNAVEYVVESVHEDGTQVLRKRGTRSRVVVPPKPPVTAPRLSITIELGNDAMQTAAEVGDAVNRALIQQSASALDPLRAGEVGTIVDANGNTVGTWTVQS